LKIQRNVGIAFAILMFVTAARCLSQGFIVPNGIFSYPSFQNTVGVIHNPFAPNGNSATGISLIPDPTSDPNFPLKIFAFDPFTDIGVSVFFVSPNDPISLQPILSMDYTELSYPNSYVFKNGVPLYVGLYTGNFYQPDGTYGDPSFGWAELENVNGTIEILNGAVEYQGGGIYAGTQTIIPIPEPPSSGILMVAAGIFFWRERVKQRA